MTALRSNSHSDRPSTAEPRAWEDDTRPAIDRAAAVEDALDSMLADSFPASDPPSFTPVTGETKPRVETPVARKAAGGDSLRTRLVVVVGLGLMLQAAVAFWLVVKLKGRSRGSDQPSETSSIPGRP